MSASAEVSFHNALKRGSIKGVKLDENGGGLGGAVIGLFAAEQTEFTAETAVMTAATADDGSFSFTNVSFGVWNICEIAAPEGYVLDGTVHKVVIAENGQTIDGIRVLNKRIKGNIALIKLNAINIGSRLSGAEFSVYLDSDGSGGYTEKDCFIGKLKEKEAEPGVYVISDLPYGRYFITEEKAPEGFVRDENSYEVFIKDNGKTYWIENIEGIGFVNGPEPPKLGSIKIIKTSDDGIVKDFSFRITGDNGYDRTFVTDENGEIFIDGLYIGSYIISEIADRFSSMYLLPPDKRIIVETDKTTLVEMHNTLIPKPPKTGDQSRAELSLLFIGAAAAVVGFVLRKNKNRNRKRRTPIND